MPEFKASHPVIKCTAFEDNTGALELAKTGRMRAWTKHVNLKYHHFWQHVLRKEITPVKVDTKEQLADIGTKPLKKKTFRYLRRKLMGW